MTRRPPDVGSGCEEADFTGFPRRIALIQRGGCAFAVKAVNAQDAGVGAIVFNQGNAAGASTARWARPRRTGRQRRHHHPGGRHPAESARRSRGGATGDEARSRRVDARNEPRQSINVSRTPRRAPTTWSIVGSHLDSVPEGPGINDNGSGSAFNLELAIQMAKNNIKPANKRPLRLVGRRGVRPRRRDPVRRGDLERGVREVAANLNFDMLASPNHAQLHPTTATSRARTPGRRPRRTSTRAQ